MKEPDTCSQAGCAITKVKAPYMTEPPGMCLWVKETFFDKNIPAPTPRPYLGGFSYSQGSGPPFCAPVWYSYRYVKNSDGRYGPLSKWTGYDPSDPDKIPSPIFAGPNSKILPCAPIKGAPPSCSSLGIPPNTCGSGSNPGFNVPKVVLVDKIGGDGIDPRFGQPDAWTKGYTLNVHRQVGTGFDSKGVPTGFDSLSEGHIVGSFSLVYSGDGTTAFLKDAVANPMVTNMTNCGC